MRRKSPDEMLSAIEAQGKDQPITTQTGEVLTSGMIRNLIGENESDPDSFNSEEGEE